MAEPAPHSDDARRRALPSLATLVCVAGLLLIAYAEPQARVLAVDRGIDCVTLDYDAMRGVDDSAGRLF